MNSIPHENMASPFIERLAGMMEVCRLSSKELAEAAEVSPQAMSSWKLGRTQPKIEVIAAWILKYKINANWLLAGIGEMQIASDDEMGESQNFLEKIEIYKKLITSQERELELLREQNSTLKMKNAELESRLSLASEKKGNELRSAG